MITVVAGGDSFIFGSELKDQTSGLPSMSTYSALLAKNANLNYLCAAEAGNANNAISRQVITTCEQNKNKNLLVIVMWTFTHRYEFRFNYSIDRKSSPWYSINLWDIVDNPASLRKEFKTFNEDVFNAHLNNSLMNNNVGITDFAKTFYKHVGNNELYEFYTTLKEILFLQQYLHINKIPFLFVPADIYLQDCDYYKRHNTDKDIMSIYNQIDWDMWYTFPAGKLPNETIGPRGFYQWAIENKYPVGTTHPLEAAHQAAAELIQEKFNELVTKSVQ